MSQRIRTFSALAILLLLPSTCVVAAEAGIHFFVSPDGVDTQSGTQSQPFASITRAQQAVRDARVARPDEAVTVHLRPGHYTLDQTVQFTAADSGHSADRPVRYQGNGEVVLSGGRQISEWQPDPYSARSQRGADRWIKANADAHVCRASR